MSALDFSLYETSGLLVIAPSGRLDAESASVLRGKVQSLSERKRSVVLDLLRVVSLSDEAVLQILSIESDLRGTGADLAILCVSEEVLDRLSPWRNLFRIHPSLASLLATGFQDRGFRWSRRTGFRLAAPVAVSLGAILAGWMGTLMILVLWQFRMLQVEGGELERLRGEQSRAEREIADYETRLKPLADLGLLEMPQQRPLRRRSPDTGGDSVP
ncbi:MAG TPA: STAS domain-containing protein [Fibrobacteria bacterium]|nr:STAS domain-containing protein [Fibrobacteria bacterium]